MSCEKCGYRDKKEVKKFEKDLCRVCAHFAPEKKENFLDYIKEKVDWKTLDTFRKYGQVPGQNQKSGMSKKAEKGNLMTRAPLGYDVIDGKLVQNQDASKIHSLFKTFLEKNYSLNSISKNFSLSVNGLKKVLSNRTYLGEIKFDGQIHKGTHQPLISPEIFYAVQRKLKEYLRPRKGPTVTKHNSSKNL
jgi:hypothetical protein